MTFASTMKRTSRVFTRLSKISMSLGLLVSATAGAALLPVNEAAAEATHPTVKHPDAPKVARPSAARPSRVAMKVAEGPTSWCAPEYETLAGDVCHISPGSEAIAKQGTRTLVIFLHGAIAKDVTWQFTQEKALARQAKQSGFTALFPKAPLSAQGHVWPGTLASQEGGEAALIDTWLHAKRVLEARDGKFDQVFVMGFSSGAYFVSSLALRGRMKVDGYAVFAGGAGGLAAQGEIAIKPPVFVGVCADDAQTADHSRAFGGALAARGFPHRVDEQRIGHMFGDAHVAHAVKYLREAAKAK